MSETEITVRPATADDEGAVAALWQAAGLVVSYNDPTSDFRFARAKSNSDVLVGVDGAGTIVGSVMVGHDGHRGWLYYVAADPERRGQGIGRTMTRAAEVWLTERKIVKAMLMVRETNTQVADFYRRDGYETIPRLVMQKWLNRDEDA